MPRHHQIPQLGLQLVLLTGGCGCSWIAPFGAAVVVTAGWCRLMPSLVGDISDPPPQVVLLQLLLPLVAAATVLQWAGALYLKRLSCKVHRPKWSSH